MNLILHPNRRFYGDFFQEPVGGPYDKEWSALPAGGIPVHQMFEKDDEEPQYSGVWLRHRTSLDYWEVYIGWDDSVWRAFRHDGEGDYHPLREVRVVVKPG